MALYVDTDNNVSLTGLNNDDGSYVNNATVRATVYEANGSTEVSGQSWPVTLNYQSGTDGNYSGVIDDAASLVDGAYYWVEITAEHGATKSTWRNLEQASYRAF